MWREQFDKVRRHADGLRNLRVDFRGYALALACLAQFCGDDEALGAGALVGRAESYYAAGADAFYAPYHFFEFVGVEIAAAFDDDVFGAAGDVELFVGAIG